MFRGKTEIILHQKRHLHSYYGNFHFQVAINKYVGFLVALVPGYP
jgi:hypothetical protein